MILAASQLAAVSLAVLCSAELERRPVKVTVIVVLASDRGNDIDPKLKALAAEVQKREPNLTSFQSANKLARSIAVGQQHRFELPNKQSLQVTVQQPRQSDGRAQLTIRPPGLGEITYECVCGKYLPVVTPQVLPSGERLVLAIMASPCLGN